MNTEDFNISVSISTREDGMLEAGYIRFKAGKVAKTKVLKPDVLLADYDAKGDMIGLEILSPVRLADLKKAVDARQRKALECSMPPNIIANGC